MRDTLQPILKENNLTPAVYNADQAGAIIDMQGANALEILAIFGASGDTLSGSVYMELLVEHGDDPGLSDAAPVVADDIIGDNVPVAGVVVTVDDPAEDDQIYNFGYVGIKRYVRVTVDFTGTHTNGTPLALTALKSLLARTGA